MDLLQCVITWNVEWIQDLALNEDENKLRRCSILLDVDLIVDQNLWGLP